MSRRKPGDLGPKQTISAAAIAAELGLNPGSAPKDVKPRALTPHQARLKMSNKYVGEAPDIGLEEHTVRAGRDMLDLLGVDPATLPVGVEAELGRPEPRPERRREDVPSTPSPPPPTDASAKAKLAADFSAHAAKVAELAESAKQSGDAAREAKAAAEVRASTEVGEALKARGVL